MACVVAAVLCATVLTACGASSPPQAPGSDGTGVAGKPAGDPSVPSDIDVDFAQMMIVHTRQSVEMVALVADRSGRPEIVALAEQVGADDAATIEAMSALLTSWGEVAPDEIALTAMDHSQMDHEGIGMGFMAGITDDQVTLLSGLDGDAFDGRFLKFMLSHRGAAVAMAQSERLFGQASAAKKIAKGIEAAQRAQMGTIQDLRGAG